MTHTITLSVRALHVPFGHEQGLADISFDVASGERLVLLGPSGEGKTTLLRAIAGLVPVSSGHVLVRHREVTQTAPEVRNVVYLHQVPVLFPHLRVRDNVAFPLTVRGVARRERDAQVQPLLERLGLAALPDRLPHALSGGQRHRVALARALAAQPAVLLLDEPLAALDPALRADVRHAIEEAHAVSDAALVLVTHDLEDAARLGDRVAVLLQRRIAQCAAPAELFARPATLEVLRLLGVHTELSGVVLAPDVAQTALGHVPIVATSAPVGAAITVGLRASVLEISAITEGPADHVGATGRVVSVQHAPSGPLVRVRVATQELLVPVPGVPSWLRLGVQVHVQLRDDARHEPFPAYPC